MEDGLGHTGAPTLKGVCTIVLVSSLNSINTIGLGFASGGLDDSTTIFVIAKIRRLLVHSSADERTNLKIDLIGCWCTKVGYSRYYFQHRLCLGSLLIGLV